MVASGDDAFHGGPGRNHQQSNGRRDCGTTHHTHALPGSDQGRDTDHEPNGRYHPPAPTGTTEGEQDHRDETSGNPSDPKSASEDHAGPIAVADAPADEVGMSLVTQRPFNGMDDIAESRGVCGVGQRLQQSDTLLGRQVQLPGPVLGDVGGDHAGDFVAERLNGDFAWS